MAASSATVLLKLASNGSHRPPHVLFPPVTWMNQFDGDSSERARTVLCQFVGVSSVTVALAMAAAPASEGDDGISGVRKLSPCWSHLFSLLSSTAAAFDSRDAKRIGSVRRMFVDGSERRME